MIVVFMIIFNGFFLIRWSILEIIGLNKFVLIIKLKYKIVKIIIIFVGVIFIMFFNIMFFIFSLNLFINVKIVGMRIKVINIDKWLVIIKNRNILIIKNFNSVNM